MQTSDVRLIGPHLLADVLAAAAIARAAGAGPDAVARAAASFAGLEHAMELVDEIRGVRFVNDSKATNIDAARQAIETFGRGLVVIMGGRFKGGDLRLLRPALASRGASVVAIGESAPLMQDAFDGAADGADRRLDGRGRARGDGGRAARRQRAAGARVRQFRHVRELRRARPGLQGRGGGAQAGGTLRRRSRTRTAV